MITFSTPHARFNYRVAGVCIDGGHILLQGEEARDFWTLPGGRVEMLEPSEAALRRELREELGLSDGLKIERLLWVVENFFTLQGTPFHELGLYYQVAFPAHSPLYQKEQTIRAVDTGIPILFQWFPLDSLGDLPLYPLFLRTALLDLPTTTQRIVQTEANGAEPQIL